MRKEIIVGIVSALGTTLILYFAGKITQFPTVLVPSKAVVAFHAATCPDGWREVDYTKGRCVIGVGEGTNLTTRHLLENGGEEQHLLIVDELPSHSHPYGDYHYYDEVTGHRDYQTKSGDDTGTRAEASRTTGPAGGGLPHNNMSPYVALLYCEKE